MIRRRSRSQYTGKNLRRKRIYIKKRKIQQASTYTNVVPFGSAPVARRTIVKLKYADELTTTIATLVTTTQQWRMNSIFDPDYTNVGHQPYGRDTLALLYTRYRVFRFGWDIKYCGTSAAAIAVVVPQNGNTAPSSITAAGEMPLAQTGVLPFQGGSTLHFRGSVYLPMITGTPPVEYKSDDRYSAAMTTNPTEELLHSQMVHNTSAGTIIITSIIQLTYWVELFDPIVLGQS